MAEEMCTAVATIHLACQQAAHCPCYPRPSAPAHLCDQVEGFIGSGGVRADLVGVGGQAEGALGAPDGRLIRILIHTQHLVIVASLGMVGGGGGQTYTWYQLVAPLPGLGRIVDSCAADGEPLTSSPTLASLLELPAALTMRMRATASGAPLGTSLRRWRIAPPGPAGPAAPAVPCQPPAPCCRCCCRSRCRVGLLLYIHSRASQPDAAAPARTLHQVQLPTAMPHAGLQGRAGLGAGVRLLHAQKQLFMGHGRARTPASVQQDSRQACLPFPSRLTGQ